MSSTKVKQRELTPPAAARARILKGLRHGDIVLIGEVVKTNRDYVKQVLRYRPKANSSLAQRIWHAADRLVRDRNRFKNDLSA